MGWQRYEEQADTGKARYEPQTLKKVMTLAQRLQSHAQETLTGAEIAAIGAEIGLQPAFIREALSKLTPRKVTPKKASALPGRLKAASSTWWAAAWILILLTASQNHLFSKDVFAMIFFSVIALYVGVGVWLSNMARAEAEAARAALSRGDLVDLLVALQQNLEEHRQHHAILSLDVAGEKARDSFEPLRAWADRVARESGSEAQEATGDGLIYVFPADECALRTARRLIEGLTRFVTEQGWPATALRIRCGVGAGEVALEREAPRDPLRNGVRDRATAFQQRAEPDEIVFGEEVAAAAIKELDRLEALPEPVAGERAFSWRAEGAEGSR
jgi:hypothetical protein